MKLLIFAASHRPESMNRSLAKYVAAQAKVKGVEVDFAEYGEFDMPIYNDDVASKKGVTPEAIKFSERAANAQGIVICSPEYNWSYPGSLKSIIDWVSRIKSNPLSGKTVILLSATTGGRGGILGLSHLKTPLEALHMHVFHKVFPLSHAQNAFDASGGLIDIKQQQALNTLIDNYISFTQKFGE